MFYLVSLLLLCLFVLAAVFHGHRRSAYEGTAYYSFSIAGLCLHCAAFAIMAAVLCWVSQCSGTPGGVIRVAVSPEDDFDENDDTAWLDEEELDRTRMAHRKQQIQQQQQQE